MIVTSHLPTCPPTRTPCRPQEAGHAGVGANEPRTPPGAILDWAAGALESLKARHPEVSWWRGDGRGWQGG